MFTSTITVYRDLQGYYYFLYRNPYKIGDSRPFEYEAQGEKVFCQPRSIK